MELLLAACSECQDSELRLEGGVPDVVKELQRTAGQELPIKDPVQVRCQCDPPVSGRLAALAWSLCHSLGGVQQCVCCKPCR